MILYWQPVLVLQTYPTHMEGLVLTMDEVGVVQAYI